jgi:predicted ATPase
MTRQRNEGGRFSKGSDWYRQIEEENLVRIEAEWAAREAAAYLAPLYATWERQHTLEALLAWLVAEATRQPVLFIVEDLHWIDPSTLEFVTLLIERGPTAPILTVLTCRPEFQPPWPLRAHVTLLTLGRLAPPQVAQMMLRVTGDCTLPREIVQQVVTKTVGSRSLSKS